MSLRRAPNICARLSSVKRLAEWMRCSKMASRTSEYRSSTEGRMGRVASVCGEAKPIMANLQCEEVSTAEVVFRDVQFDAHALAFAQNVPTHLGTGLGAVLAADRAHHGFVFFKAFSQMLRGVAQYFSALLEGIAGLLDHALEDRVRGQGEQFLVE